ncbi:unnamed protein product [Timema podura]|uniref:Uncharacterized protein n=1 Tax=Timema podura TaxID=61482 RepID=A0ABN7NPP0_TIMPD|nr:unnamed protein product [Timema podura]
MAFKTLTEPTHIKLAHFMCMLHFMTKGQPSKFEDMKKEFGKVCHGEIENVCEFLMKHTYATEEVSHIRRNIELKRKREEVYGNPFWKNHPRYTRPRFDSRLPVIGGLVYESRALDHVAIEACSRRINEHKLNEQRDLLEELNDKVYLLACKTQDVKEELACCKDACDKSNVCFRKFKTDENETQSFFEESLKRVRDTLSKHYEATNKEIPIELVHKLSFSIETGIAATELWKTLLAQQDDINKRLKSIGTVTGNIPEELSVKNRFLSFGRSCLDTKKKVFELKSKIAKSEEYEILKEKAVKLMQLNVESSDSSSLNRTIQDFVSVFVLHKQLTYVNQSAGNADIKHPSLRETESELTNIHSKRKEQKMKIARCVSSMNRMMADIFQMYSSTLRLHRKTLAEVSKGSLKILDVPQLSRAVKQLPRLWIEEVESFDSISLSSLDEITFQENPTLQRIISPLTLCLEVPVDFPNMTNVDEMKSKDERFISTTYKHLSSIAHLMAKLKNMCELWKKDIAVWWEQPLKTVVENMTIGKGITFHEFKEEYSKMSQLEPKKMFLTPIFLAFLTAQGGHIPMGVAIEWEHIGLREHNCTLGLDNFLFCVSLGLPMGCGQQENGRQQAYVLHSKELDI